MGVAFSSIQIHYSMGVALSSIYVDSILYVGCLELYIDSLLCGEACPEPRSIRHHYSVVQPTSVDHLLPARVGHVFFSKECNVLAFFSKETQHSCILLRSL